LEVLFVLGHDVWFALESAELLKRHDLSREMSGSNEIAIFVQQLEGALHHEEFVSVFHVAQCHHTGQFTDSCHVAIGCAQLPALNLDAHSCDVLDELLNLALHLLKFRLLSHCEHADAS